ncbi:MAG TPA: hypothetical protein VMU15_09960 [Anaeromyxobacter sp.]|nr:hypothetical protein [Anaeromyxobacter sp.]
MDEQRADVLSRSILAIHRLAGPLTVATWLAICGGFALEVVPRHDGAEQLYRMDAARDAMARSARADDHLRRLSSQRTRVSAAETSSDVASGK